MMDAISRNQTPVCPTKPGAASSGTCTVRDPTLGPDSTWENETAPVDPSSLQEIVINDCDLNTTISFLVAQRAKNLPAVWETQVRSLGLEDPLEKGMATHSSILA